MTTRISAYFQNSDMAELCLAQLRRAGVSFTLTSDGGLLKSRPEFEQWVATGSVFPYSAVQNRSGGTQIKIRLDSRQAERASEIIRQAQGQGITARF